MPLEGKQLENKNYFPIAPNLLISSRTGYIRNDCRLEAHYKICQI